MKIQRPSSAQLKRKNFDTSDEIFDVNVEEKIKRCERRVR